MTFVLSKLVWVLLTPSNFLIVGAALLAIAAALTGWRWASGLAASWGLALLLACLLPVGQWLARPLEDRFALPSPMPKRADGVIVLGGAQDSHIELARGRLALDERAERLIEGVGLARRYPEARLVFSGGSAAISQGEANERRVNERFVRQVGFDPARVTYEDRSRNTWENALFSKELLDPQPGETWFLVTSAQHMPRSVGIFRRAGFEVIPYPVDYDTGDGVPTGTYFMASQRLVTLDFAVREWLGLTAYRLMGRTDAWFPAPGGES